MGDTFPESLYVIGPLIGEPSRLRMLWALLDGRSYTAGELAAAAAISPASASMHLVKLADAGLLQVVAQGRHRYYQFCNERVAHAVEALGAVEYRSRSAVAHGVPRRLPAGAVRHARACYGHLAGEMGVAVWETMMEKGWIVSGGAGFALTEEGTSALCRLGVDAAALAAPDRQVKPCMDWTERTFHLGGALGRRLLDTWIERGDLRRNARSRVLEKSPGTTVATLLARKSAKQTW